MNQIIEGSKRLVAFATKLVAENPHTCVVETLLGMDGRSAGGDTSGLCAGHLLVRTEHCTETVNGHGEAVNVTVWQNLETRRWRVIGGLVRF